MTNNVKTLINTLNDNGFVLNIYEHTVFVDNALDRLIELFKVYGKSQLGTTLIDAFGVVNYYVDGICFAYVPF